MVFAGVQLLETTSSINATQILNNLFCRPATLVARLWPAAILTATAMSAATDPDPLPNQMAIVGQIDTPERSDAPINVDATLGSMRCSNVDARPPQVRCLNKWHLQLWKTENERQ